MQRLLDLIASRAVYVLQLRELARQTPERLATEAISEEVVKVVALLAGLFATSLTCETFWHEMARHGGHLGRRGDEPPGWKTLWRGWLHIQAVLEGVRLAAHFPP